MPNQEQLVMDLSNVCDGKINRQFQDAYRAIAGQLEDGEAGTISITVKLKKMPDTTTMFHVEGSVKPTFPVRKQATWAQITDDGLLKVDKPKEAKDNVVQLTIADAVPGRE